MKFLPFAVLIAFCAVMVGCGSDPEADAGAPASEKLTPIEPTGGGNEGEGESAEGDTAPSDDGETASNDAGSSTGEPEVAVTKPETEKPPVAAGSAVDLGTISIPVYSNSKAKTGVKDETKPSGNETLTVITRATSDEFAKVQGFYKSKLKWTSVNEFDDMAIYEIEKGNTREIVAINTNDGSTDIVITKIVKK